MTGGQGQGGAMLAGRYELRERLGRGGMATVRRAYQPALDRFVAVKLIDPRLASDPTFVERFRQEARIAARLRHPNILSIYDFGDDNGTLFLVTELVTGGTLDERLDGFGGFAAALDLVEQIGRALDYAHAQGIVHRDVKPANIFLEGDRAILADFGIAKQFEGATAGLTASGVGLGTPEYMAPEQVLGRPVDGRADLYALGIILYRLIAGRLPFVRYGPEDTALALVMRKINEPIPSPSTFNPAISPTLDAILLRALATDPADRYPSAAAFVAAARGALGLRAAPIRTSPGTTFVPTPSPPHEGTGATTRLPLVPSAPGNAPGAPGMAPPPSGPGAQYPPNTAPRARRNALRLLLGGAIAILLLILVATGGVLALSRGTQGAAEATATPSLIALAPTVPVAATATLAPATPTGTTAPVVAASTSTPTIAPTITPVTTRTVPASPSAVATPQTATPTPTPTVSPSPAVAPSPTISPSPTASPSPTPSPPPTATPDPTATPSPTAPAVGDISAQAHAAILSLPGTSSGVFIDLTNGANNASDDPNRIFSAASLIKLSIAGATYQRAADGGIRLSDQVVLKESDKVGGTGIIQYQPAGTTYTIDQLIAIMLLNSDNTAANLLVDRIGGFNTVNAFSAAQGMNNTIMRRKLNDLAAQARGLDNTTTSGDIARFFSQLQAGQIVDRETSDRLRTILAQRGREDKNWSLLNLPADIIAQHMTGTGAGLRGDAILVTAGAKQYILVLFVSAPDEGAMETAIARVSDTIYGLATTR